MSCVVGIDLGTSKCCVAVWRNGTSEVIGVNDSSKTTPCIVGFTSTERLVGDSASRVSKNQQNTVFGVKRLIGRDFDDPVVQDDAKRLPFSVVDVDGKPRIQVEFREERKLFAPAEISAMILQKVKEAAETVVGCEVKDAVVSVPAFFNDAQRHATIAAAKIAGFKVLRIINESTATALTYATLNSTQEGPRNILIFDLGGGTLDVSIAIIEDGSSVTVRSTSGDTQLGGKDFDDLLVHYLVNEFKRKENKDATRSSKAMCRLRMEVKNVKRQLSSCMTVAVDIDALVDGVDFSTSVSRSCFEGLCSDLFNSTLEHVQKALDDTGMEKTDIDDVVLVGGSTRIPKIQALLQKFFDGKKLNTSLNPEEAVAYGAAIHAAVSKDLIELNISDINSLSLDVDTKCGFSTTIIKKHTTIPCKVTQIFSTSNNNQKELKLKIYEGNDANQHAMVGEFVISGFPPAPARGIKLSISFHINNNGTIKVSVTANRVQDRLVVKRLTRKLSTTKEIHGMMADARMYRDLDEQQRARVLESNKLEVFLITVKNDVAFKNKPEIVKMCDDALEWLNENKMADAIEFRKKFGFISSTVKNSKAP